MSLSHLLILGIIAIIVIPPEKLPEVARQFAKFLTEMRRMTSGVFDDLKQDVILKPEDMLKKQQQAQKQQQKAPQQSVEPEATVGTQPQQPREQTEEEKKKAEEEYLKFIQGDPVSDSEKPEEKKPTHE